ncbi:LysR family transcriptional regulator [Pseudomonas sp. PP3]|uniref:LysR family transcriptional regulator n=1 Tax=Pseudomonas sp. PP3 TaxID=2815936 RepID=UPI001BAE7210|nr:LysR family transcriptional regulator [Pseudomonas sp. PP3]
MDKLMAMRTFLATAEQGSFTAAGRLLGVSSSTVIRDVSALEASLGAALLDRSTRCVALTQVGAKYRDCIKKIVSAIDMADFEVVRGTLSCNRRFRVNVPIHLGRKLILPHIQKFMERNKDISLCMVSDDGVVDVRDNTVDLRVFVGQCTSTVGLITRTLGYFEYCLVASPGYLARHGRLEHPEQLAGHACLTEGENGHARWLLSGDSSVSVHGVFSSNDPEILRKAAISGVGVAFLPSWLVHEDVWANRLISILPLFTSRVPNGGSINIEYPLKYRRSLHVREFIKLMQEALDVSCVYTR